MYLYDCFYVIHKQAKPGELTLVSVWLEVREAGPSGLRGLFSLSGCSAQRKLALIRSVQRISGVLSQSALHCVLLSTQGWHLHLYLSWTCDRAFPGQPLTAKYLGMALDSPSDICWVQANCELLRYLPLRSVPLATTWTGRCPGKTQHLRLWWTP